MNQLLPLLCLLAGSASAANLDLTYPGYIWGQYSGATNRSAVAAGIVQQGVKYGSFPLVPYVEEDYYNSNTLGLLPTNLPKVASFSTGLYAKVWNTPFKVGACYVYDDVSYSRGEVYVSLYEEWK